MNEQLDQVATRGVFGAVVRTGDQAFLTSQIPSLGTKVRFKDGREFVFCSSATTHAAGVLKGMAAASAELTGATGNVGAVGATEITIMTGVVAAGLYDGGTIHMLDDTGEGYTYKIKHQAAGTVALGAKITLYDPLIVAIAADTDTVLVQSPFVNTIENTATTIPVGVTLGTFTYAAATGPGYFWVQTKGAGTILMSGDSVIGVGLQAAAAGAAAKIEETTFGNRIGTALQASTNGHSAVWLNIGNV